MIVAGYIRYSSENQRDGNSVAAQRRALDEYCKSNSHTVYDYFIDEAKSGTSSNRARFMDLIDVVKSKKVEAVVVHKLDRFARNQYDSAIYSKVLQENGVKLISVLEPMIAEDNPEANLFKGMIEAVNAYYSENLAREVFKGHRELAMQKKSVFNRPYFGFDLLPDRTYKVNEHEAEAVRRMYQFILDGKSLMNVAKWLNLHGYYYHVDEKKPFTYRAVRLTLINKMNIGTYCYRDRGLDTKGDPIYIENAYPPIVSRDVFVKVCDILEYRQKHLSQPRKMGDNYMYLLTGYLECGCCHSHLTGFSSKYRKKDGEVVKFYKYRCTGKKQHSSSCNLKNITKDKINDYVISNIKNTLLEPNVLKDLLSSVKKASDTKAEIVETNKPIKQEIRQLKSKKGKLVDLYLNGDVDKSLYKKRYDDLNNKIDSLEFQLSNNQIDTSMLDYKRLKKLIDNYEKVVKSETDNTYEYHRSLLDAFVEKVIVNNETITIKYKKPFGGKIFTSDTVSNITPYW